MSVLRETVGVDHTCVYLRNDAPAVLFASARSDAFEERFDFATTIDDVDDTVGHAIETGEPVAGAAPGAPPAVAGLTDVGSWCVVPLGGEGVLLAVTPPGEELDDATVGDVDLVGAYLEAALAQHADAGGMTDDARLAALERAFPDYGFVYDADGRYLDVLLGTTNIQLYRRQELLGSTVDEVMDPDVAETVLETIQDALTTGEMQVIEYGVDTPGGTYWYEARAAPVEQGSDEDTVVLVARDITDRYEREQELQRQNERLEEFASIVSHDFRNPLNTASGYLELAREECEAPELEEVAAAHEQMESLVEDLLALARQGRTVVDPEPVDVAAVARTAWKMAGSDAGTLTVDDGVGDALADDPRLQRLFENLFRNAVEHSPTSPPSHSQGDAVEHGSTSPRSRAHEDAVEQACTEVHVRVGPLEDGFYVEDDGPGIPPERRDRVLDAGYSTADEGTGLGLNIVQRIAAAHDWSIAVTESAHPDTGTRFEVTGVAEP